MQQIAYHAATDFVTIMRFLVFAELYIKLLSCLLILVAGSYFGWRAWKVSREPFLADASSRGESRSSYRSLWCWSQRLSAWAYSESDGDTADSSTLVRGFPLPPLRIDALRRLGPYFINTEHANHQWAWVVMGCDAFTCLTCKGQFGRC